MFKMKPKRTMYATQTQCSTMIKWFFDAALPILPYSFSLSPVSLLNCGLEIGIVFLGWKGRKFVYRIRKVLFIVCTYEKLGNCLTYARAMRFFFVKIFWFSLLKFKKRCAAEMDNIETARKRTTLICDVRSKWNVEEKTPPCGIMRPNWLR